MAGDMERNPVMTRRWWSGWLLAGVVVCLVLSPLQARALQSDFARPEAFAPDVNFWKRIYTEVDTDSGLLHDNRYLDVVYTRVDLPSGASPAERRRITRDYREQYRELLLELARNPELEGERAERVRNMFGEDAGPADFRAAADRVRFQLGQSDRFRAGLERAGRWEAHIRQIMREHGVPEGMVALPHVESSFTPYARSRAGAAGMWQFTRGTGQRFMQVDNVVDERLDPWQSSEAAARLLKHNREVTGSWELALNAYNHGAAGIRRAIESVGEADIVTIAREYNGPRYGFASRNFYPAFLAALAIHDEPDRYFDDLNPEPGLPAQALVLEEYVPAHILADALDEPLERLRAHNPALQRAVWDGHKYIPRGYHLRLPPGNHLEEAGEVIASLPPEHRRNQQVRARAHTMQRGETLSHVAQRYGTSVRELARINGLTNTSRVQVGQRIRLPGPAAQPRRETPPEDGVYTVRPGDSLSLIAARFDTSVRALVEYNDLDPDEPIIAGNQLRVAEAETGTDVVAEEEAVASADSGEVASDSEVSESESSPAEVPLAEGTAVDLVGTVNRVLENLGQNQGDEGAMGAGAHRPDTLAADPSDYAIDEEGRIEIQWGETLGHVADWLEIRTQRLRELNGLEYGEQVTAGQRLLLEHGNVDAAEFENRRRQYHRHRQNAFFEQYDIAGTREYEVSPGDSVWSITRRYAPLPVWLLQQHNPDVDMTGLRPGETLQIPELSSDESSG